MHQPSPLPDVSVQVLAEHLASGDETRQLVDVREPAELEIVQLPGFTNLPLSQFAEWSDQIEQHLDRDREIWVLCHHGVRSAQMCAWLLRQGYPSVKNITGGIHAYTLKVQPDLPVY